jgi:transcriptional regulator with XRE-family HTH domain
VAEQDWERTLSWLFAPTDENGRRIPSAPPLEAPASWPAPRGRRGPDGRWRWTLAARPDDSYVNDLERRSVAGYRELASQLVRARVSRGLTLRSLSAQTGLGLSVLTGLEQGSAWPSFETVAIVASALGCRVQVAGSPVSGAAKERGDHAGVRVASWLRAGYPPAIPWQIEAMGQLQERMWAAGLSRRAVARAVGVRHNTVTELYHLEAFRFVSVRTLAPLCAHLETRLEVVAADAPWS